MRNLLGFGALALFALVLAFAIVWLAPAPPSAGAVESSVTVRRQHRQCDREVWALMERRARERAEVFCEQRGGVDEQSLRFVHHDSPRGAQQLCIVHLHYGCRGALAGE
ncbi:MAG TPA: hypothetical protein VIL20_03330 [Sandaracinaceae bacterium]